MPHCHRVGVGCTTPSLCLPLTPKTDATVTTVLRIGLLASFPNILVKEIRRDHAGRKEIISEICFILTNLAKRTLWKVTTHVQFLQWNPSIFIKYGRTDGAIEVDLKFITSEVKVSIKSIRSWDISTVMKMVSLLLSRIQI